MRTLQLDLRDAFRALRRTPGFTMLVVLTLGVGIGMNTAVFTLLDALLFKSLPYAEADRLVRVAEWPESGGNYTVSPAAFLRWRGAASFSGFEARVGASFALLDGDAPEAYRGARITPGYFELLGIRPARGRGFEPQDAQPNRPCTAVISHRLWRGRFAEDASSLGSAIRFSGQTCTLIGVLPPDSVFDRNALDVYVPLPLGAAEAQNNGRSLTALARLAPGVTLEQARDEMIRLAREHNATRGAAGRGWTTAVTPLRETIVRADARQLVGVMTGAVIVVLLVACTNVAGLALSRTIGRRREIAVRIALGASRARIFRYLVVESLLLSGAAAAVGLLLGSWALRVFLSIAPPATLPAEALASLDARALLFTMAIALGAGLLFGTAPAWRGTRTGPAAALAAGGRAATGGPGARRFHDLLVSLEVALAMVLVVAAVALVVSLARLTGVDPGFRPDRVLTARLSLPALRYGSDAAVGSAYTRILDAIRRVPGVEHAGAATSLPLGGWLFGTSFSVVGFPDDPARVRAAHVQHTTSGYFEALGIPLAAGRAFSADDQTGSTRVAIVNETFVERFLPDRAAVGRELRLGVTGLDGAAPSWRIVGVIRDVKTGGLADDPLLTPEIYVPHGQVPAPAVFVAIRASRGSAASLGPAIRTAVRGVDPELPVGDLLTMDERLGLSVGRERFRTRLMAAAGLLALLLASLGVYAVRAQAVAARIRELGIRLALGAPPRALLLMVVREGLRPVAVGLALGLAGAWWFTRWVEPWLFATRATDPLIVGAAAALFAAAAVLASLVPARRASRVDPVGLLRLEGA